jgi:uncharacterized protein with HEPN domain
MPLDPVSPSASSSTPPAARTPLRNLQTMAEATKDLSEETRARRPDVQWRSVSAFRNTVVHDYRDVDLGTVWQVTQRDVPELKTAAEALLPQLNSEADGNDSASGE